MWESLKREVLKPCSGSRPSVSPKFGRNDWRRELAQYCVSLAMLACYSGCIMNSCVHRIVDKLVLKLMSPLKRKHQRRELLKLVLEEDGW